MTDRVHRALLPAGLKDVLPPDAESEATVRETLISAFVSRGYDRVKPPLIEFEDSLVSGSGEATSSQTFRMMDPVSQLMLGVRPDMTLQVARIATTRLIDEPRPLRLSYAGEVLRVRGSSLRPERQFAQVGAELIGSDKPEADAEVILMAGEALNAAGADGLSVDLGLPTLVAAICREHGVDPQGNDGVLRGALNQKDAAAIKQFGGPAAPVLGELLAAAGGAAPAIERISGIDLPDDAEREWSHLVSVAEIVKRRAPSLELTIDPVEIRGYEYHSGVTFTIFSKSARGELGRGGRYIAGNGAETAGEAATGITLFLDTVIRSLPDSPQPKRIYLPTGSSPEDARRLRAEGWITVPSLSAEEDGAHRARALGCTHILVDGEVSGIGAGGGAPDG